MKVSPDGFVLGMWSPHWVYGSQDHGKSWYRLESWVNMSEPHFLSARHGIMVAAEMSITGRAPFKVRQSSDGGKTWKVVSDAPDMWWPLQPLWTDASGERWYTRLPGGSMRWSTDQGKTWR
jgi:photosystem II stability/assembly factor-like uncharacterized protein